MWIPVRRFRLFTLKLLGMKIGENTIICRNVSFRNCKNIEIGAGCVINSNCLLDGRRAKIIIGNNVDIAQEVIIWTLEHDSQTHEPIAGKVIIGNYCWIGCRSVIMPNCLIGDDSICAACSVVTKDVKPNSIVGGVPAKFIRNRNRKINYKLFFNSMFR